MSGKARSKLGSTLQLLAAVLPALAILISLGTWQVHRLAWKEALIADADARVAAVPVPLPEARGFDPLSEQYLKVSFQGTFDHAHEFYVFATLGEPKGQFGGPGWWVVTPATLKDGRILFVNRGFVPDNRRDPQSRAIGQITGLQDMVGLVRPSEDESWITPAANPAKNEWFVRNPASFAKVAGLPMDRVLPFTVDLVANSIPGGLPQAGETLLQFPNSHLGYVITWYGLAITLLAIAGIMLMRIWKQPRGDM